MEDGPRDDAEIQRSLTSGHPRLWIWIIAGVFYLFLCGMVGIVLALLLSGEF